MGGGPTGNGEPVIWSASKLGGVLTRVVTSLNTVSKQSALGGRWADQAGSAKCFRAKSEATMPGRASTRAKRK